MRKVIESVKEYIHLVWSVTQILSHRIQHIVFMLHSLFSLI